VLRGKVHAQRPSLPIHHSPLVARLLWLIDTLARRPRSERLMLTKSKLEGSPTSISLADIDVGPRLRAVDEKQVQALAESMASARATASAVRKPSTMPP